MEMGCEYGTEWDHERSIVRSFDLELWPDDDAVRVDKGLVLQGGTGGSASPRRAR